jgi:Ca2+/H+ antiporter
MTATPAAQPPQNAPAGQDFPGKTLGIVGLILAIFFNLIGLIVSAIALNQSKKAGFKNTPALAGVIVGAILLVIGVILTIVLSIAAASMSTITY